MLKTIMSNNADQKPLTSEDVHTNITIKVTLRFNELYFYYSLFTPF